eukprot:scaffold7675_cov277-Pinguiococcus_pyrenoidosus.AAC.4
MGGQLAQLLVSRRPVAAVLLLGQERWAHQPRLHVPRSCFPSCKRAGGAVHALRESIAPLRQKQEAGDGIRNSSQTARYREKEGGRGRDRETKREREREGKGKCKTEQSRHTLTWELGQDRSGEIRFLEERCQRSEGDELHDVPHRFLSTAVAQPVLVSIEDVHVAEVRVAHSDDDD